MRPLQQVVLFVFLFSCCFFARGFRLLKVVFFPIYRVLETSDPNLDVCLSTSEFIFFDIRLSTSSFRLGKAGRWLLNLSRKADSRIDFRSQTKCLKPPTKFRRLPFYFPDSTIWLPTSDFRLLTSELARHDPGSSLYQKKVLGALGATTKLRVLKIVRKIS